MPGSMYPQRSEQYFDKPLTDWSVGWQQSQSNAIAMSALGLIPVTKESGKYQKFTRADFYRNQMKKRAPGTKAERGGWKMDAVGSFSCDEFSLAKPIDDRIRATQDNPPLDIDRAATKFLSQQALINMEEQFLAKVFKASTWTGSTTGGDIAPGTKWDAANSTPIKDLRAQIRSASRFGYRVNTLVLTPHVFDVLIDHDTVVGRFDRGQTTGVAVANEQTIAALLNLERVLVMRTAHNTANEGATEVTDYLADEGALLLYTNPRPGLEEPTGAALFTYTGLGGSGENGQRIYIYRENAERSDVIEISQFFDIEIVAPDLGAFFSDVLT